MCFPICSRVFSQTKSQRQFLEAAEQFKRSFRGGHLSLGKNLLRVRERLERHRDGNLNVFLKKVAEQEPITSSEIPGELVNIVLNKKDDPKSLKRLGEIIDNYPFLLVNPVVMKAHTSRKKVLTPGEPLVEVKEVTESIFSLLNLAVETGSLKIIAMLLSSGFSLKSWVDEKGVEYNFRSPVIQALRKRQDPLIPTFLVFMGENVNEKDPISGMSPMDYVIMDGRNNALKNFLRLGGDPNLHYQDAISKEFRDKANTEVLEETGLNYERPLKKGDFYLSNFLRPSWVHALSAIMKRELLRRQTGKEKIDHRLDFFFPLEEDVSRRHFDKSSKLVAEEAALDTSRGPILKLALHANNIDGALMLLKHGATPSFIDSAGNNLIHFLAVKDTTGEVFDFVLKRFPYIDVDLKNDLGLEPIHLAAIKRNYEFLERIADESFDSIRSTSPPFGTVLHILSNIRDPKGLHWYFKKLREMDILSDSVIDSQYRNVSTGDIFIHPPLLLAARSGAREFYKIKKSIDKIRMNLEKARSSGGSSAHIRSLETNLQIQEKKIERVIKDTKHTLAILLKNGADPDVVSEFSETDVRADRANSGGLEFESIKRMEVKTMSAKDFLPGLNATPSFWNLERGLDKHLYTALKARETEVREMEAESEDIDAFIKKLMQDASGDPAH